MAPTQNTVTMNRINIGGGRWFNSNSAECYEEAAERDSNGNLISHATGSQWDHECLYQTSSGVWVLNWWSQWQGSTETYKVVAEKCAYAWLIDNNHEVPGDVFAEAEL